MATQIIDGFGSYVNEFMKCDVFRGIGGTAHKYYMLFQHHLPPPPSTYTSGECCFYDDRETPVNAAQILSLRWRSKKARALTPTNPWTHTSIHVSRSPTTSMAHKLGYVFLLVSYS